MVLVTDAHMPVKGKEKGMGLGFDFHNAGCGW